MQDPIHLPDSESIEQWKTLGDVQFVETSPRAVPLATFVRYPSEGYQGDVMAIKTGIPASKHLKRVRELQESIEEVNNVLVELYTKRSIVTPLTKNNEDAIHRIKQSGEAGIAIAESLFNQLFEYMSNLRQRSTDVCRQIGNIINADDLFVDGQWSEYLLDSICCLVYKLTALEKLASSKTAISNDLSQLKMYCNAKDNRGTYDNQMIELKMWIGTNYSITKDLLKILVDTTKPERVVVVFKVLYKYIRKQMENRSFLIPEQRYQYIVTLKLIFKFYIEASEKEIKDNPKLKKSKRILQPLKDDYVIFLKTVLKVFPLIPLIYDCTIESYDNFDKSIFEIKKPKVKHEPKFPRNSLIKLIHDAQENFNKLSILTTAIMNSPKRIESNKLEIPRSHSKAILDFLPEVLRNMSMIMGAVREIIIQKQLHHPVADTEEKKKLSLYELSMRYGFDDQTLMALLTLLWIVRSTHEFIISNITLISQAIADATQDYLQNFALNLLPQTILRNSEYKDIITSIVEKCRIILAYFDSDQKAQITAKKVSKLPTLKPNNDIGVPSISTIKLIRTQLELFTNKGAVTVSKQGLLKGQPLDADDEKMFKDFIEKTTFFENLIALETTIDTICDQSVFFFKEYYMALNDCTFFPVSVSLPVILTKFALKHYKIVSLSSAIFYPLSIYDDAAACALRVLKSRMLYNEIKAEASICIQYISREVAQKAFMPIMKFATLRMLQPKVLKNISTILKNETVEEDISSIRLSVIFKQNTLTIFGTSIDTKSLISQRINEIFMDKINEIMALVERYGLVSIHIMTTLVSALRKAHNLFTSFNLSLMPFDDLLRISLATDNPASLQSRLLSAVTINFIDYVLSDYSILTFPLRIIPQTPIQAAKSEEDISKIFKDVTGKVLSALLTPTLSFISTESFKQFFWMLDDGAIMVFHQQILNSIPELVSSFIEAYQTCNTKLKRIQNPPINTTCYQTYDRFDGAYHYFIDSVEARTVIGLMSQIGNVLLACQMMDNAYVNKRTTEAQVSAFMFSDSPLSPEDLNRVPELFELYDKDFHNSYQYFTHMGKKISPHEINPPMLHSAVSILIKCLLPHYQIFAENSPNLLNLQSLDGFASVWSVLEFISCNIMALPTKDGGGVLSYGEGIYFCAMVILLLTGQYRLFRAISISEKIMSHKVTDFSSVNDARIENFISSSNYAKSSSLRAYNILNPIIDSLIKK